MKKEFILLIFFTSEESYSQMDIKFKASDSIRSN